MRLHYWLLQINIETRSWPDGHLAKPLFCARLLRFDDRDDLIGSGMVNPRELLDLRAHLIALANQRFVVPHYA